MTFQGNLRFTFVSDTDSEATFIHLGRNTLQIVEVKRKSRRNGVVAERRARSAGFRGASFVKQGGNIT